MYTPPGLFTTLLLLSSTFAAPHGEDTPPTPRLQSQSPASQANKSTQTVFLTLTRTIDTGSRTTSKLHLLSALNTPLKESTFQTRTRKPHTLTCPRPTEPCIIDGIAIWPSSTPSRAVPSCALDTSTSPASRTPVSVSVPKSSASQSSKASLCTSHAHPSASQFTFPTTPGSKSKFKVTSQLSTPPSTASPTPPLPTLKPPTIQDPVRRKMLDEQGETERKSGSDSVWGNSTERTADLTSGGLDPIAWAGRDKKAKRREEGRARKAREVFWGA